MKKKTMSPEQVRTIERLAWSTWTYIASDAITTNDGKPLSGDEVAELVIEQMEYQAGGKENAKVLKAFYALEYEQMEAIMLKIFKPKSRHGR
jgi:hypothetical protein